ncbi:MAG: tetratricopeptide repeat protein, partial [Patescibacteria group bacterium]|nr:tetratricopeptide repeat protein [Patescibacteria group bacterium]
EEARRGDEKARLILMLADVYHEAEQWQQSLDLCSRVIDGAATKASGEQKSYAHFKRGWTSYRLVGKGFSPDAVFADYSAAVRTAPKAPWADKAMFKAANIQWNHKRDSDAAAALWERLCRSYPESQEAIRSAYYIGVAHEWSNRTEEAVRAFQYVLDRWPDSAFTNVTRDHLERLNAVSEPEHQTQTK